MHVCGIIIVCARVRVNLEVLVCHCSLSLTQSLSSPLTRPRVRLAHICISLEFCNIYIILSHSRSFVYIGTQYPPLHSVRRLCVCLSLSLSLCALHELTCIRAEAVTWPPHSASSPFPQIARKRNKKPPIVLRLRHRDRIGKWQHCRM